MDEIDQNLLDAWHRVAARCKADRVFAAEREAMAKRAVLRRPMRAWCVALRASDTRISAWDFLIEPERAPDGQMAHTVTLDAAGVAKLTAAVRNPAPGLLARVAAAKVGVRHQVLMAWAAQGKHGIQVQYHHRTAKGGYGHDKARVWWAGAIDPQHLGGEPPDAVWGTLWQGLGRRVPKEFQQVVQRVPRLGILRGQMDFTGWDWKCPGTVDGRGKWHDCGRICRMIYAPVPLMRMQDFYGDRLPDPGIELAPAVGQEGHVMRFACERCVGWQGQGGGAAAVSHGWDRFVRHISGGLLFGSDVERPAGVCEWKRRKRAGVGLGVAEEQVQSVAEEAPVEEREEAARRVA